MGYMLTGVSARLATVVEKRQGVWRKSFFRHPFFLERLPDAAASVR